MRKRTLGRTGMEVSLLGFGASEIGRFGTSLTEVEKLLGQALDAGLNVIDTAECYGDSEEKIGLAVSHRRGDYYLLTKCGHASGIALPDWHPDLLEASIDRSLRRLRTDYLDLIQLHSCSASVLASGEALAVLDRARQQGKVRYIGYSGDGEAALFAVRSGAFDCLQISVNIADQEALARTIPEAVSRGMGIIAKRPIANAAWRYGGHPPDDGYHLAYWNRLRELDYDFVRRSPREAAETALRFTMSLEGVATCIVGTTRPGRWQENAGIVQKGPLPDARRESIRQRWLEASRGRGWAGV